MLGSAQALRQRERPFGNHDRSIELALLIEFDDLVVELVEIVRSARTRWSDRRNDREPSRNCEPNRQSRHCPTGLPSWRLLVPLRFETCCYLSNNQGACELSPPGTSRRTTRQPSFWANASTSDKLIDSQRPRQWTTLAGGASKRSDRRRMVCRTRREARSALLSRRHPNGLASGAHTAQFFGMNFRPKRLLFTSQPRHDVVSNSARGT